MDSICCYCYKYCYSYNNNDDDDNYNNHYHDYYYYSTFGFCLTNRPINFFQRSPLYSRLGWVTGQIADARFSTGQIQRCPSCHSTNSVKSTEGHKCIEAVMNYGTKLATTMEQLSRRLIAKPRVLKHIKIIL